VGIVLSSALHEIGEVPGQQYILAPYAPWLRVGTDSIRIEAIVGLNGSRTSPAALRATLLARANSLIVDREVRRNFLLELAAILRFEWIFLHEASEREGKLHAHHQVSNPISFGKLCPRRRCCPLVQTKYVMLSFLKYATIRYR
jgi:hypothetical protein